MQSLLKWDLYFFKLINYDWSNSLFDYWMPLFRNAPFWNPLYFFLIAFAVVNFKKTGWWWVLFAAITASCTDLISSQLIKGNIIRVRPCNEFAISEWVRVLVAYRPQSSSFTSSHAANHFGLAFFLYLTLKDQFTHWPKLFFVWAGVIGYAQIYVGVHYPIDIIGGALVGCIIGYFTARIFNKQFGLY
jgi:membrane-associated phospholipid phosphatase